MGGCACAKGFIGQGAMPRDPMTLRPLDKNVRLSRDAIRKMRVQRVALESQNVKKKATKPPDAVTAQPKKLSREMLRSFGFQIVR